MRSDQPDTHAYATALLALARAANALSSVERDLTDIVPLLETTEVLRRFMTNPLIDPEGKRQALDELVGKSIHPVLLSFLCLLIDLGHLSRIGAIADAFFDKVSELHHTTSGELISAVELPSETVTAIELETGRLLNKQVSLHTRVDRTILGGVIVRVGDFVVDGTLDHQLDRYRDTLLA